jgi:hypothetical protein
MLRTLLVSAAISASSMAYASPPFPSDMPQFDIAFECSVYAKGRLEPSERLKDPHDLSWRDQRTLTSAYSECEKIETEGREWIYMNWQKIRRQNDLGCVTIMRETRSYGAIAATCGMP